MAGVKGTNLEIYAEEKNFYDASIDGGAHN
jgi:hypothetical protein